MEDGGSVRGGLIKHFIGPALGVAALVAAQGWVWTFGPHGWTQPKPNCAGAQDCVIVAGLDRDVFIGFGAGDQVFGLDVSDDMTERLVGQLRGEATRSVFKYPGEIAVPQTGARDEIRDLQAAYGRARELGRERRATLVVIGRVIDDQHVSIGFVDPSQSTTPTMFEHDLNDAAARPLLRQRLALALAAARSGAPPPPIEEPAPAPTPPMQPSVVVEKPTPMPASAPIPPTDGLEPYATTLAAPVIVPADLIDDPTGAARLAAAYPAQALRDGATGRVDLRCRVARDGRVHTCIVITNTNPRYEFARVALNHAASRWATPQTADGVATDDGVVTIPFRFNLDDDRRSRRR